MAKTVKTIRVGNAELARIVLDTGPIDAIIRGMVPGGRAMGQILEAWGVVYMAFIRKRFQSFSRGGGWPALAPSTVEAKGASIILIDLGVLRRALSPGAPGSTFKIGRDSITVGVGEPVAHPGGAATIADIMLFHQNGNGVPRREILVVPEQGTVKTMMSAASRVIERLGRSGGLS